MKFGKQFEFHKIPEWYTEYLEYQRLKASIKEFNKNVKCKSLSHISYLFIPRYLTYTRRQTLKAKRVILFDL